MTYVRRLCERNEKMIFQMFSGILSSRMSGFIISFSIKGKGKVFIESSRVQFYLFCRGGCRRRADLRLFLSLKMRGNFMIGFTKESFQILAASERRTRKTLPIWGPKRGEVSVGRIFCEEYQRQLVQPTTVWQYFRGLARFSV